MQSFQTRYVKTQMLGFIIEKPAPDPKTKPRRRRNHGNAKRLSYYATINGAGLRNIALLNRIANKRHGKHIVSERFSEDVEDALCALLANPFRDSKHVPDLSRKGERDRDKIGRDYSAFPKQKKAKAAYRAAKGRRAVVATPRQSPWEVPPKYATSKVVEQAPAVAVAPARLNLKPVVGK